MLKYDRTSTICKKKQKNLISQLLCCSQIPTVIARAVNKSSIQSLTHRNQHWDQVSAIGFRDLHKNVTVGLFQGWCWQRDGMDNDIWLQQLLLIYLEYKG